MTPRGWLEVAVIAAAALLGAGWCHQVQQTAAARAVAEIHEQRADSLYSVAAASEAARDTVEVHARVQVREAEARRARAEEVAAAAAARRPELVERIVHAAAPADTAAVRAVVVELEAAHAEEVSALRIALEEADRVIAAERLRVVAADRLAGDLRAALEVSRLEADSWKTAARPGILGLRIGAGTGFVAGVAVGAGIVFLLAR